MFDDKSRYKDAETYQVTDARGREVTVVATPSAPRQDLLGYHVRKEGQRLDHMAYRYLDNAAGFWRIAELNDAVLPDALAEADEIAIPTKALRIGAPGGKGG